MLFQLIVGPFSTLHTLPKGMSLVLLVTTGFIASISLGSKGIKIVSYDMASQACIARSRQSKILQAGETGAPEIANITLSFIFIALSLLGFAWQFCWHRLEDNFDCFPWAPREGEKQQGPCPFTGKKPEKRCPSCGASVHSLAFHLQERLTTFYVGESVLGWDQANKAGNMVDTPELGRALLDEALDWRGNYYFGCTGNACVGCSSHQRCFRMLPRWALVLACIACVGSLVPWAFRGSLKTVQHGGKIQAIAETYGIFFSLTAIFIQAHSIAGAVVFMTTYHHVMVFPSPILLPDKGPARKVIEFMAGQTVPEPGRWKPQTRSSVGSVWKQLSQNLSALTSQLEQCLNRN